jgi:hypothetical protein
MSYEEYWEKLQEVYSVQPPLLTIDGVHKRFDDHWAVCYRVTNKPVDCQRYESKRLAANRLVDTFADALGLELVSQRENKRLYRFIDPEWQEHQDYPYYLYEYTDDEEPDWTALSYGQGKAWQKGGAY